jgi:hypothetical protein
LPFFKDIRCLEQVAGPLRVGHCRPFSLGGSRRFDSLFGILPGSIRNFGPDFATGGIIIRKSAPSADPFTIDKHFMAICTHSLPSFWHNLTTICLLADFVIFVIGHLNFLSTNIDGVNYKKSKSHMVDVICVDF